MNQLDILQHLFGSEHSKTSSSGRVPSGLEGNMLNCLALVQPQKDMPKFRRPSVLSATGLHSLTAN